MGVGFAWGQPGTLTFDRAGRLYLLLGTQTDPGGWADASQEVLLATSTDRGRTFDLLDISSAGGTHPAWLASIERPFCGGRTRYQARRRRDGGKDS